MYLQRAILLNHLVDVFTINVAIMTMQLTIMKFAGVHCLWLFSVQIQKVTIIHVKFMLNWKAAGGLLIQHMFSSFT